LPCQARLDRRTPTPAAPIAAKTLSTRARGRLAEPPACAAHVESHAEESLPFPSPFLRPCTTVRRALRASVRCVVSSHDPLSSPAVQEAVERRFSRERVGARGEAVAQPVEWGRALVVANRDGESGENFDRGRVGSARTAGSASPRERVDEFLPGRDRQAVLAAGQRSDGYYAPAWCFRTSVRLSAASTSEPGARVIGLEIRLLCGRAHRLPDLPRHATPAARAQRPAATSGARKRPPPRRAARAPDAKARASRACAAKLGSTAERQTPAEPRAAKTLSTPARHTRRTGAPCCTRRIPC
jgi:hypothetical protein